MADLEYALHRGPHLGEYEVAFRNLNLNETGELLKLYALFQARRAAADQCTMTTDETAAALDVATAAYHHG